MANSGDSRAVAFLKSKKTEPLSYDHKPDNDEERQRIENAGGYVEDNRVNANLNLSRAIGDFTYKANRKIPQDNQQVIVKPDVKVIDFNECEFIIMACDGIYDCVTNEELTEWFTKSIDEFTNNNFKYVPKKIKTEDKENSDKKDGYLKELDDVKKDLDDIINFEEHHIVQKFLDHIVADDTISGKGTDNMTCILIKPLK